MATSGKTGRPIVSRNGAVIFVTVGAQMPFDRLVKTVDQWAFENGRNDVFAQIGQTEYRPSHIPWTQFLAPDAFRHKYETADLIVAHAGTGSLITALQLGKPILIMPRHASLRETRNDHQVATSKQFSHFDSVTVAWDEQELFEKLECIESFQHELQNIRSHASHELIEAIREFIDAD